MLDLTVCLDPEAEAPLYQQLYAYLTEQIRTGGLKKGDRLPGKRSLAGQLAVAVFISGTVSILVYAPVLMIAGIVTGFFTGKCAQLVLEHMKRL